MFTWILVANASQAKLFSTNNLITGKLELIKEFSHPDSRKKGIELVSDRGGNFPSDAAGSGSHFGSRTAPKEVEADHFALELAKALEEHEKKQAGKIIVICPAHLQGLFKKHFHREFAHLSKDYTSFTKSKLVEVLEEHFC